MTLTRPTPASAWLVILGGVSAALHVAKLSPAIPALQRDLGVSLVTSGLLLSLVLLEVDDAEGLVDRRHHRR